MRLFLIVLALAVVLLLPFFFWGEDFAAWFSGEAGIEWLRSWGVWAWAAILALLIGDLFLPVPATPLMSAAGYIYGVLVGGLLSAAGSFLSGLVAYGLCRSFGRRAGAWLVKPEELARGEDLFKRRGPWLVALSRWLPLLPEVVACLAGFARMRFGVFTLALACGCLPLGFTYAAIGAAGQEHPGMAIALSAILPAILWLVLRRLVHQRQ